MEKNLKEKLDECLDGAVKKIVSTVIDVVLVKVKEGNLKAKEITEERKAMREEADRAIKKDKKKSLEFRRAVMQKRAEIEAMKNLYIANVVNKQMADAKEKI